MLFFEGNKVPPNLIRQTNVIDKIDSVSRLTVASSTDSLNSQEGIPCF